MTASLTSAGTSARNRCGGSKLPRGVWPVTEWHEAFEKMHKGEVVKSVLRPV
jgi:hypothetical protein